MSFHAHSIPDRCVDGRTALAATVRNKTKRTHARVGHRNKVVYRDTDYSLQLGPACCTHVAGIDHIVNYNSRTAQQFQTNHQRTCHATWTPRSNEGNITSCQSLEKQPLITPHQNTAVVPPLFHNQWTCFTAPLHQPSGIIQQRSVAVPPSSQPLIALNPWNVAMLSPQPSVPTMQSSVSVVTPEPFTLTQRDCVRILPHAINRQSASVQQHAFPPVSKTDGTGASSQANLYSMQRTDWEASNNVYVSNNTPVCLTETSNSPLPNYNYIEYGDHVTEQAFTRVRCHHS